VAYVVPEDFLEVTAKPWCRNLIVGEGDVPALATAIVQVTSRIEHELQDDFEPPNPDNDVVFEVDGSGQCRLYCPRRIRSITSVKLRDSAGALTVQDTGTYRVSASLNAAGTAMVDQAKQDWLEVIPSRMLSTGADYWPVGPQTVQLTGKFGWGVVPDDIKRLVALQVYALVRPSADPLTTVQQVNYGDHVEVRGESREAAEIVKQYRRRRRGYAA
jgi:hypothetical protein